jgi:DNA-binding transcriptional regulator GbsR (MarR family)
MEMDIDTSGLHEPVDAKIHYNEDDYYKKCDYFIQQTFNQRLDKTIGSLRKAYGRTEVTKEAFIERMNENAKDIKIFRGIYEEATTIWNSNQGVEDTEDEFKFFIACERRSFARQSARRY